MLIRLRKLIKREEGQKGFTLVELIIVMAILAVLAALAVPKFGTVLSDAKDKARLQNQDLILNAADLYASSQTDTADATIESNLNHQLDESHVLYTGKYLKKVPKDPITKGNYTLTGVDVQNGNVVTGSVTQ